MLNRRYQEAARSIELLLEPLEGVRTLNERDMSFYNRGLFSQGWEIPGLFEGAEYMLRVLLPYTSPFSPPRIAVWPTPSLLEWPHLEEKGLLCLMSDTATYSIYDCGGVTKYLLIDAIKFVNDSLSGANISDFEDEFQSYWGRWDAAKNNYMYIFCLPIGPSRWVSSWHSQGLLLVADNEAELLKWIEHRYGKENLSKVRPQKIPLLWLPRPLRPKEYPKSVNMLCSILKALDVDNGIVKRLLVDEQLKDHSVVLGFQGRKGAWFAGLFIGNPAIPLKKGGFTKKRPPDNIIFMRYGGAKIIGAQATRLDSSWIHGRDYNLQERLLSERSVIIFGIGSIGSFIAKLLEMSGVGELILVDPEMLSSENPGRHVLGINSIGRNKAKALAEKLNAEFPHLKICGYDMTCENFFSAVFPTIQKPDLIISTIGSWQSEGWLNAMAVNLTIHSPILYGWTEPHAAAGHAVVFHTGQGCLRCIRDDMGKEKLPVTSWPEDGTMVPVLACGGYFQPYGAVELSHIHGLIADLALDVLLGNTMTSTHKIWIGPKKIIESAGGRWNISWIENFGEPGKGGYLKDIEMLPDTDCPECGRRP